MDNSYLHGNFYNVHCWAVDYSWIFPEGEDIRIKHLVQHHEEQVKYDRMIELLEETKKNSEEENSE